MQEPPKYAERHHLPTTMSNPAPESAISPSDGSDVQENPSFPDTVPPAVLLRRVPQQDRGQRRIERILQAAAEVIAEVGVEQATTNAIAARAETSVGSLYQFFPNKDAIVQALAARYVRELGEVMEASMPDYVWTLPAEAMADHVVTPLARFHDTHPAYRHVWLATLDCREGVTCGEAELHEAVHHRIAAIMRRRCPLSPASEVETAAHVCQEMVHALLNLASTLPVEQRPPLVREIKRALAAYATSMESRAGEPDATGA
jgi:AcrR family transcriptional regulator